MGKSSISMAIFNSSPDPPWAPQTRHMKPDSRAASSSRNGWWTLSWSTSQPGGFSSTSRSSVDVGRHPKCKWTWKSSYRCICIYIYICGMIWRDRKLWRMLGCYNWTYFGRVLDNYNPMVTSNGHWCNVSGSNMCSDAPHRELNVLNLYLCVPRIYRMWISRKHPHSPSTVSKIYTCMCRIFEAFDCESSIAEFVYLWMIYGQKRHV